MSHRGEGPSESRPKLPAMCICRIVEKSAIRMDAPPTSNDRHKATLCTGRENNIYTRSSCIIKHRSNSKHTSVVTIPPLIIMETRRCWHPNSPRRSRYPPRNIFRLNQYPYIVPPRPPQVQSSDHYHHHIGTKNITRTNILSDHIINLKEFKNKIPKLRRRKVEQSTEIGA